MNVYELIKRFALPAFLVSAVAACSGGSGQDVELNPPPAPEEGGSGIVYNGPAPSTDDVQNFKLNVWDNLVATDRCGGCHNENAESGVPPFVHTQDINVAYDAVNDYVDLSAPVLSTLVTQMLDGHNCWENELNVCADVITNYIEQWASASGAEATEVILTPPPELEVGSSKSFPAEPGNFETTIYPLLTQYCANCHSEDSDTQQQPFFASNDLAVAYQAARSKINLDTPENSRFVLRLGSEFHNCWDNCSANATEMENEIRAFSDSIPITEVNPDLVISRALGLPDGIVASSGGRFESNVIALYEFKTGSGSTAFDTSGVDPALHLNLTGNTEWIGSWGVRINDGGKAQGSTASSRKLHSLLTATGEYSIEAWVVPDNVAQDGPARIVTYSGGADVRNFTLGQTTYDYNFLSRSSESDANGMPMLSTPSADEVLQATLQHVVVNYDPIDGRSIYVNGELITENTDQPGNLNEWDDTFALAIGAEVDGQDTWLGTMRLLAIHNRVLSAEEIFNNFEAGVGEKFFLLFGVSQHIDMPQAYVVFEVQQYDNYSYLFNTPFFISLDGSATVPNGLTIEGMRIGVNGQEAPIGQTFANLNTTIDPATYDASTGVLLSGLGALVPLDKGPDFDQFFLSFDRIGNANYDRPAEVVPPAPAQSPGDEQSDIGVRTFDEVNLTLSILSTVPTSTASVASVYETVRQQLPTVESATAFLSSHQSGVMQLAVAYCNALVADTDLRSTYFPGVDFSAPYATAFAGEAGKNLVITPLMDNLLAGEIDSSSLASVADPAVTQGFLSDLIDEMSASDTPTTVVSTCAAALGSAVMLVQ